MRSEKLQISSDIQGLLSHGSATFLVAYKGMKVADFSELRKRLATLGAECHVVPNRILRRAAAEVQVLALADLKLAGDTALVSGGEDAAQVAKVLTGFAKEKPALAVKLGVLDRKIIDPAAVKALAELPPREVLLAMVLGTLQAPATKLVGVLNAKAASVVHVIRAFKDKKEQAGSNLEVIGS